MERDGVQNMGCRTIKMISTSAFTLLELLAVVAIFLVLAALLMASAKSVLARAAQAKCIGNLKAIGTAGMTWAADNNGMWPYYTLTDGGDPPSPNYGYFTVPELYKGGRWDGIGKLYDGGYITQPGVFYCPAETIGLKSWTDKVAPDWKKVANDVYIAGTYSQRGFNQYSSEDGSYLIKLSNLSGKALLTCWFLRSVPSESLSFHKGVYPTLFGDGHVANIDAHTLLDPQSAPGSIWADGSFQQKVWQFLDDHK